MHIGGFEEFTIALSLASLNLMDMFQFIVPQTAAHEIFSNDIRKMERRCWTRWQFWNTL